MVVVLAQEEARLLDHNYVGMIERGERNVSIDNMERLAMAVDATIQQLLQP